MITDLLDDLIIILSEAVGELAVQDVDLHKEDVPGAKQRRHNADERITAAMRLVESISNPGADRTRHLVTGTVEPFVGQSELTKQGQ